MFIVFAAQTTRRFFFVREQSVSVFVIVRFVDDKSVTCNMPERFKVTKTAEADAEFPSPASSQRVDEESARGHLLLDDKVDGK